MSHLLALDILPTVLLELDKVIVEAAGSALTEN